MLSLKATEVCKNGKKPAKTVQLLAFLLVVLLSLSACGAGKEESMASDYRDLLLSFDYGNEVTYVIGHKNPDSETGE